MADSSDIDNAVVEKLRADAQLTALMPDGVFFDLSGLSPATGKNATRFVLVSLVDHLHVPIFQRRGFEDGLYLVKAVARGATPTTPGGDVKGAAARIEAVLEDQVLVAPGFTWMTMYCERRFRTEEKDDVDATIRWLHRGGFYRVQMTAG